MDEEGRRLFASGPYDIGSLTGGILEHSMAARAVLRLRAGLREAYVHRTHDRHPHSG
jgi:hypothetical protein